MEKTGQFTEMVGVCGFKIVSEELKMSFLVRITLNTEVVDCTPTQQKLLF